MSTRPEKVLVLVDVQNAYYTTRDAYHAHLDYNQLWMHIRKGRGTVQDRDVMQDRDTVQDRDIVQAFAYAIDRGDKKQQEFQNILRAIGFEVKLKPYIQRSDGSAKGDWDVGITIDAMLYAEQVDTIVLVSGDGDFDLLAKTLREHYQKDIEVYGVPKLTANSLISAANRFIPIEGQLLLGFNKV